MYPMEQTTKAYVIILCGKYLRKVGNSHNRGFEWTDTVAEARLYASETLLDKHLLAVARNSPDGGPWPEVVELTVTCVRNISHSERFKKNRERSNKAEATRQANWDKIRQTDAQRDVLRLEWELKHARERAGLR